MGDAPSGIGGQSFCAIRYNACIGFRAWYRGWPSGNSITVVQHTLLHSDNKRQKRYTGDQMLTRNHQTLEAVVAPHCSMTSGATGIEAHQVD